MPRASPRSLHRGRGARRRDLQKDPGIPAGRPRRGVRGESGDLRAIQAPDRLQGRIGVEYLHRRIERCRRARVTFNVRVRGRQARGRRARVDARAEPRATSRPAPSRCRSCRLDGFFTCWTASAAARSGWMSKGASKQVLTGAEAILHKVGVVFVEVEEREVWKGNGSPRRSALSRRARPGRDRPGLPVVGISTTSSTCDAPPWRTDRLRVLAVAASPEGEVVATAASSESGPARGWSRSRRWTQPAVTVQAAS